jgi:hypothetical protein
MMHLRSRSDKSTERLARHYIFSLFQVSFTIRSIYVPQLQFLSRAPIVALGMEARGHPSLMALNHARNRSILLLSLKFVNSQAERGRVSPCLKKIQLTG